MASVKVLLAELLPRRPRERQRSAQHLVGHDAEHVNIRRAVSSLEAPALGGCIRRRPRTHPRMGGSRRVCVSRDTEVCETPRAVKLKDILGLEIAVDDAAGFEVNQRVQRSLQYRQCTCNIKLLARCRQVVAKRPFGSRHNQNPEVAVLAAVDDRNDVPSVFEAATNRCSRSAPGAFGTSLRAPSRSYSSDAADQTSPKPPPPSSSPTRQRRFSAISVPCTVTL